MKISTYNYLRKSSIPLEEFLLGGNL